MKPVFMDGTEKDSQRYGSTEEQRKHYSGKKSTSVKNNVLVSEAGRVVFLSRTYEGSKHNKMIVDEEGWLYCQSIILHQDIRL